ncbi:MAG: hypothetical protein AMXMBFR31_10730 [Candidatus Desulfobacillus denitrificans]|uniref:Uncharacterized protein n=1 Tax=Candidatus Desulfobacillus denitrificans TaxID=2608985 RepID=A0A809RWF6_9PROT|nr:hypothetical protein DSYM_12350 [Candidatus Desulfobacillus denitrificans]
MLAAAAASYSRTARAGESGKWNKAAAEGATPGTAQAKGLREGTNTLESDGATEHPSTEGARCGNTAAISQVQGTEG